MAYEALEELEVFQIAEKVGDRYWEIVEAWNAHAKATVGRQLVRAADSIGANIAESYGRFHFGERIQFLYYARGSIYETKFWTRRARTRSLVSKETADNALHVLDNLALKLNTLIRYTKSKKSTAKLAEPPAPYKLNNDDPF
jgi:four helix bundle protein